MRQSRWEPFIFSMLFFASAFTIGTVLHWPTTDAAGGGIIFVKLGVVFGLLGAIYGAIHALDIRGDSASSDRPVLRTVVCAGLGGLLVFSLQIPSPFPRNVAPVALGAGVTGLLGYVGWRWAKHIDF